MRDVSLNIKESWCFFSSFDNGNTKYNSYLHDPVIQSSLLPLINAMPRFINSTSSFPKQKIFSGNNG